MPWTSTRISIPTVSAHTAIKRPARSMSSTWRAVHAARACAAFVVKQHYDQTAQIAYLARKEVPGVEVFGMLCSNRTVGGLNPEAVHHFTEVIGGYARIVSMPTWDAENYVRQSRNPTRAAVPFRATAHSSLKPSRRSKPSRTRRSGTATPDSHWPPAMYQPKKRCSSSAKPDARASNGSSRRMRSATPINMTLAQMKEAAGLGAYIEFVANFLSLERASFTVQQYHDAIRAIGPAHVILSSDGGQINRPFPDDLIAQAALDLREMGLTDAELRTIMVENPATLLSLPQRAG